MKKFKLLFIAFFTSFMMIPLHVFAFQLQVESEGKESVIIEVEDSDTIEALKAKIETALEIPIRKQIIYYNEKKLEDGRTIVDYAIPNTNSKIQVTLKEELNVFYVTFDNPVSGNKPDLLGDVVLANKDGSKKVELKDIKLEWSKLSEDGESTTLLKDTDLFENNNKYLVTIAPETNIIIDDELEKNDCVRAEEGEIFYNDKLLTLPGYCYIGGINTIIEETDSLIIGKNLPSKVKYTFITDNETKEFVLDIDEWTEVDEDGNRIKPVSGVVEAEKRYSLSVDATNLTEFKNYLFMSDIRTELIRSGTTKSYYVGSKAYKVIFEANGGNFNESDKYTIDEWNNKYADNLVLPTRQGYKFIGYFTEKNGGIKFEMILNESGIDDDMTFYAQWELEEEVPHTLDNITSRILTGIISLIGLVGLTISLKNKNNKRA